MKEVYLILENIRSEENVGSIFRSADAFGVNKIYLTGYTPAPLDRFGREVGKITKASLGAEQSVSWEKREDPVSLIEELKDKGVSIVSVEQSENSIDHKDFKNTDKAAFIFGNEVEGLSSEILDKSDTAIEIPMKGKKESLNVAVSAGIILSSS
ncbi:MAG: TrmH family RNA methyltransferase [Candidatus Pacebacteria bacterium]|jgi:tRNA G18 (ribose-2'-O)-methylase SpoU|nr:RNA methyltransferase [bacterium]MDP6527981.1 TrmH family RNA methyltransferase [Candidatus Paceibacterota bacterium]MDP6659761.1 TrmH family RNA methyltransferase [Candidatus Paceibacterota bacterium]|tara:strand:+ start:10050 stop:10511 length:462 start_codon:yes stop_codon:yes gene_type:complete